MSNPLAQLTETLQNITFAIFNATLGQISYTAYQVNAKGQVESTRLHKFLTPILDRLHSLVGSDGGSDIGTLTFEESQTVSSTRHTNS